MTMKRFLQVSLCLTALLFSVSCAEKFGETEQITISATTKGFAFGNNATASTWGKNEQIALFSPAYPFPSTFTQVSGANSAKASFRGTITTQPEYIGIRPASIINTTTSQSIAFSTSEPLISFDVEELNAKVIQLGKGSGKAGMVFNPLFGVVEVPLALKNATSISDITIALSDNSHPLYGDFVYRFLTEKISSSNGVYEIEKHFSPAMQLSESGTSFFIALPQGWYNSLKFIFAGYSSTENYLIDTGMFEIKRGCVTTVKPTVKSMAMLTGTWQLTSFSGTNEKIDVVLTLNNNNSFTLYQRSDSMAYKVYTGTWDFNGETQILSGKYSDGSNWTMSYYVSLSGDKLTLTSTTNPNTVSVYTKTDYVPNVSKAESRTAIVKPFL